LHLRRKVRQNDWQGARVVSNPAAVQLKSQARSIKEEDLVCDRVERMRQNWKHRHTRLAHALI
jgi:hypothetical protein